MSGVLQTATGFHIVKVVERTYASLVPFDVKVQTRIRDKLAAEINKAEMRKMVEDLSRRAPSVCWTMSDYFPRGISPVAGPHSVGLYAIFRCGVSIRLPCSCRLLIAASRMPVVSSVRSTG